MKNNLSHYNTNEIYVKEARHGSLVEITSYGPPGGRYKICQVQDCTYSVKAYSLLQQKIVHLFPTNKCKYL